MSVQKPVHASSVMPEKIAALIVEHINEAPGVLALSPVKGVTTRKLTYPILEFADFEVFATASGGKKGLTGFDFDSLSVEVKKLSTIWMAQDEALEDLAADNVDLEATVRPLIEKKFATKMDEHVLALKRGVAQTYTSDVDWGVNLALESGTPLSVNWDIPVDGTGALVPAKIGDSFSKAVSAALNEVEKANYDDGEIGLLVGKGLKFLAREARRETDNTDRLFANVNDMTYDLQVAYSVNLPRVEDAADGDTLAIVGRFDLLPILMRQDIRQKISNDATVEELTDADIKFNAFQEDLTFFRYHTRAGAVDMTRGQGFVRIVKHAVTVS